MRDGRRFYGWKVVANGALVWGLQSMIWMQGYGNLAVALREHFGWSKSFFSAGYAISRGAMAFVSPPHGKALNKFGIRTVMRLGALFTFVGMIGVGASNSKISFVIAMMVAALGVTLTGFLSINTAIVGWFEKRRARAMSLTSMGFAIGGFCGPVLVFGFNTFGWRATVIAAGTLLSLATLWAGEVMNRSRHDMDQPLDGLDAIEAASLPKAEGVSEFHFTAKQALRTRAFWMIAGGHGFALLVVAGVMANLTLYLTEDRGFSGERAALIAGIVPVFQLIGTIIGGSIGDRFNKRLISSVAMAMHGTAMLILVWLPGPLAIGAFVVLHGLAWGTRGPLMSAMRADYFGSTHYGTIMGFSAMLVTFGAITGPLIAGVLADMTGSYQLGFSVLGLLVISGIMFWVLATPPAVPNTTARELAHS